MKKSLIFLLIFLSQICLAQTDEQIEDGCKYEYPSLVDIFKKGNCISKAKKERAISEAKQKKEDAARPCLSNKIPELEANLSKKL